MADKTGPESTDSVHQEEASIESVIFPRECIEFIMNRQGARSSDPSLFHIVSILGQRFIEECLKRSIETTPDGGLIIKDENLRSNIKMENPNFEICSDFSAFLVPDQRYRESISEKPSK
ncbi:hypothetical protein OIY81_3514 [Cryptosporidium canis]|uniref:Uncharacterized protein n=1 Tax=Cryptosporidium canis TaxID=195482 RepID=A0ABQ8PBF4_9CRYT|nr:hypothetical protein OIY81_3514 [Cryptosporidium canis]KAJ1614959.1 hypothetical protein OJ252_356 [Cryptosporidium canis]